MGKVVYATGINYVNGALAKPKKQNGHKCGNYLIGTHRTAETTNSDCTRLYVRNADVYDRTSPVTAHEIEIRTLFQQRLSWVNARAKNLSTLTSDQENFLAQKDTAGGAKTWKKYLWKLAKEAITAEGE